MKHLKHPLKRSEFTVLLTVAITFLFATTVVLAQNGTTSTDSVSGNYVGAAKKEGTPDLQFTLELKNNGGKISGHATSGETTVEISEGTLTEGKLTLKFVGLDGTLTAKIEGDKITGEWLSGTDKRSVELKKIAPATAAAPPATDSTLVLTGEWDAVADAQGQPFPFLLVLKVEGEKVTGNSSSQLGDSVITNGVWKDGRLSFVLEGQNGNVAMSATVVDGKLSGDFDYASQMQGKWVAVKKK